VLWTFVPIAALVTITPGPATAMVVRSAIKGGRSGAFMTALGNSIGVVTWALLSALGVSALVAASEVAYATLKICGAAVLVYLGARTLLRRTPSEVERVQRQPHQAATAFRQGIVTSLANPKLAVFFVALFPQFAPDGSSVLPAALVMAGLVVSFDLVWYSTLALLVVRARRAYAESRLGRRVEQFTGAVLIALGARVALEHR
jgi:threonine/homoserine/homoserine lactone efflux protein